MSAITKKCYYQLLLYLGESVTYKFRTISLPVLLVFASFASLANAQLQPQLSAHRSARITAKVDRKVLATLHGSHPDALARGTIGQRLSANTQLQHMVLVLKPSDEQEIALTALLDAQQDKNSGSFHKWLTPDTFATSFGVAPSDIAQVSAWLADSGLPVESVSRSGRFITFSGTVHAVETAFNTEMHNVTVDGEAHISNTTDIAIPAALSPVVKGLARLNNFFPKSGVSDWKKVSLSANGSVSPDYGVSPAGTHYIGAADMATIYNSKPLTNTGIDGKGITISVIARSNIKIADVQTYRSLFGLPQNDPEIIVVGQDPGQNSDDIEAYLDAEMAGSLASGASVKFIVSSPSLVGEGIDTASLYAVDNNLGDIITMSYGGCEGGNGAGGTAFWNVLWEQAAAQGQTVFVSSGDSGAAGCASSSATSAGSTGYGVNALGSSNFNVAVGGTMFVDYGPTAYWQNGGTNVVPNGTALGYIPEAAMNQSRLTTTLLNSSATGTTAGSGVFAAGGGISIFTARPSWQTGSGISSTSDPTAVSGTGIAINSPITGPHRLVPDVSFISANGHDGTLFCAEGICSQNAAGQLTDAGIVGGTSVAAPAVASAQALIDAANGGRQGNANYYYYALANQQYTASTTACTAPNGTTASPTVPLPASTCNFHDVVAGSITVPTSTSGTAGIGFNAGNGYDVASGLGSMNIANVAAHWSSVNFHSTTTTLSLTPTTGNHGDTITGAVQVSSGSGTPTGDVGIVASLETATGTPKYFTLTGGAANVSISTLPAGTYNVHAHYDGDGVFAASDSAPVSVTIAKENGVIGFIQPFQVTSAGAVNAISTVTYDSGEFYLDTEVQAASGNGTPSGSVTFAITRNGSPMPSLTAKMDSLGTAYILAGPPFANFFLTPNYPTLPGGTYSVTASYSGDSNFNATSATVGFTITPLTPTVSFTATADAVSGGPVTLNFSVTTPTAGQGATGTVTFTDTTTSTSLGSVTVVNGKANLTTNALTTAGNHSITAVYSGDSNYAGITPAAVTVNITSTASTTIALTTTTASPTVGAAVVLQGAVTPINLGTASTVFFYDGGVLLGSGPASTTTGKATLSVSNFTGGLHNLTAVYGGNATHLGSTGSLALTVARNGTTMAIGGAQTAVYGQTVSYNGTLTRAVGTSTTPPAVAITGVVNFYEGSTSGTLLGSAAPLFGSTGGYANFAAAVDIPNLGAGTHQIVASYPGDASYGPSTSGIATLVISKANQTINFTGLPATVTAGSPVSFTLNATASTGLPITYSVTGPATISGTKLTINATGAATVTVTASQAGNANYNAASATQTIVVGTVQLATSAVLSKTASGYQAVVTVVNNGTVGAQNVQLTAASLGAANGSPLPAVLGTIPAGGSATITLTFPSSAGTPGTGVVEKLTGTYTGGTFGGSFRAVLPNSQQPS